MRENTGVVLWVLVIAFGVLWVLQDSGGLDYIGTQQRMNVAVVNGDAITYEEYQRAVEQRVRAYEQQTGQPVTPALRDQLSDVVFNQLVDDRLRQQEMDRLGVRVSDEEVRQMVLGPQPDPVVRQIFDDGRGGIDRARLQSVIDNPDARQDLLAIEEYLRTQRRQQKLDALVEASARVSEGELREAYLRRNTTVAGEALVLRLASLPDSAVTVSDRDLRGYYDAHRSDFERERTVTIEYVSFPQAASPADTATALEDLAGLRSGFASAESDSLFVARQFSTVPYTGAWVSADEVDPAVAEAVFADPTPGQVVGPVVAGGEAQLIKVTDVRPAGEVTAVKARHILFGNRGDGPEQRASQLAQAQQVKQQLQGGASFEQLAAQHSQDPSNARQGGDLGWFGRNRMVAPFEEAAFNAAAGEVVGPVETEYGYHLIRVDAKADREVKLAQVTRSVGATQSTLRQLRDQADDVAYYGAEGGDLATEAQKHGREVATATVQGDQAFIPGIGSSRAVRSFVERAEAGQTSEVLDTGEQFVVVRVVEVLPEGYRPFDDVRAEIEPRVLLEKKREVQVARLREALQAANGDFQQAAQAAGGSVIPTGPVTYSTTSIPGLGRAPKTVGTLLGLDQGETSRVLGDETAATAVRATNVQRPDPNAEIPETDREQLRAQLLTQKRQQIRNQWINALRDEAELEDHRSVFL